MALMYIYISTNPARFRPIIFFGFIVKTAGVISILCLIISGRAEHWWLGIVIADLIFAVLFLVAFIVIKPIKRL